MSDQTKVGPEAVPAKVLEMPRETILGSVAAILGEIETQVQYKKVDGFKPGQKFVIKSLMSGDVIEWQEANEGEAKRTAGLRLIVKALVDGDPADGVAKGVNIMDDTHIAVLRKVRHEVTERLVEQIADMNGMKPRQAKNS